MVVSDRILAAIPEGQPPLHAVQTAALERGMNTPGYAYFMEQGLGKTRTALTDFYDKVLTREATRLVVICPNSFKGGWQSEIEKWGFDFDVHLYEADGGWRNDGFLQKKFTKPPVVVINFESVRPTFKKVGRRKMVIWGKGMDYVHQFVSGKGAMLVVDESIQISTHDASQTIGVLELRQYFEYVRVLSGKPQKKGPHDLWSQYRAIGQLQNKEYYPFKVAFCRMGGFQGKQILGAQNEEILQEWIAPFTFRATKADWTDLPPKVYTVRDYKLHPDVKAEYSRMENEFLAWLTKEGDEIVTIEAAISKYIKLAQIQAGFIYDNDGVNRPIVEDSKNTRLNALVDFVDDELNGKAIVVYNHKPVKDQLIRALSPFGDLAFIHGGMTTEEIEAEKTRFNTDPAVRFICITKAAKYGHTLLGDQSSPATACSTMIFYENTYSADDRSQLEDRSHRHGQLQESMSYVDFAGTGMDKNMIRALQMKESIFQTVFGPLRNRPAP